MNKIEYIKENFKNFYIDRGPENGILQGMKYHGSATHCRACMNTLVRMLKPKTVLGIGSYRYESSIAMSQAMDTYLSEDEGVIHSFDIKKGGCDGDGINVMLPKRVTGLHWYPYKTDYDEWKFYDPGIVFKDFAQYSNEEIYKINSEILDKVKPENGYDLIFIDGDHSYDGAKKDWEHALEISNENTVVVIDNIWDERLKEVRRFFNDIQTPKWDFEEWNDLNPTMVQDTGVCLLK